MKKLDNDWNKSAKDYIEARMGVMGIERFKDLKCGMSYAGLRQAIWQNRFPRRIALKLAEVLGTTLAELESNGVRFVDIKERKKISIDARLVEKVSNEDILNLIKIIYASNLTTFTVHELVKMSEIQASLRRTLSVQMNAELFSQLIGNMRR